MKDLMEEWLSEYQNPNTKRQNKQRFKKFLTWSEKTAKQLSELSSKDAKHLLLQYQADQKKRDVPNNSILTHISAVRSFFDYLEKSIKFRRGQLVKPAMATGYHKFSNGDLGRMYNLGNAFDKALLATGVSLGWEVSAILDIEQEDFAKYVKRARTEGKEFFTFESQREKTGARRFGILNPLALESLERYFSVSRDKAGTKTDKLFPMTEQGANQLLRRLAREANIALTGTVRWHNIRRWLMSKLSRAKFNEFQIKYLLGKTIPITDLTYLETLQQEIEERYPEAYKTHLCITRYQTENQMDEMAKLREELKNTKLILRGMQDLYGEELVKRAMKRLGIKPIKTRVMRIKGGARSSAELDNLMIRVAKMKEKR